MRKHIAVRNRIAVYAAFAATAAFGDTDKMTPSAAGSADGAASEDVVWYVPGWMRTKSPHGTDWRAFTNAFPTARHVFKGWDGNRMWGTAVKNADAHAAVLADEVAALSPDERRSLTLLGHSLGARQVVHALAILAKRGIKVRSAVLLAAAIPDDDPDLDEMGLGSELPVIALCNPDDVTLKYVYAVGGGEDSCAFGAGGARKQLVNVVERAVPEDITEKTELDSKWAKSEALKRVANHHAPFYFAYLKAILDGEVTQAERVLVPQDNINWSLKVIDGEVWWDVLESRNGWKLERHKLTKHCRVLDSEKRRVAWGEERKMREAFDKVSRKE